MLEYVTDEGFSAKSLKRPGMEELLASVRKGDSLVVAKLDRLSRSVVDFASLLDRAHREGWALIVLDLGLDMTTPMGRFVALTMPNVMDSPIEPTPSLPPGHDPPLEH